MKSGLRALVVWLVFRGKGLGRGLRGLEIRAFGSHRAAGGIDLGRLALGEVAARAGRASAVAARAVVAARAAIITPAAVTVEAAAPSVAASVSASFRPRLALGALLLVGHDRCHLGGLGPFRRDLGPVRAG